MIPRLRVGLDSAGLRNRTLATLPEAFSESPLPFKVDLVDWATTKDGFREAIMRETVVVAAAVQS